MMYTKVLMALFLFAVVLQVRSATVPPLPVQDDYNPLLPNQDGKSGSSSNTYSSITYESTSSTLTPTTFKTISDNVKGTTSVPPTTENPATANCPDDVDCSLLGGDCILCWFNKYCRYGSTQSAVCSALDGVTCINENGIRNGNFTKEYKCAYCYQLHQSNYTCSQVNATCTIKTAPRQYYISECTVHDNILCLGQRTFKKKQLCNWTSGYKWSTALALSVTLGGFGVDRFYLGLWRQGIGKLFSFGGLGVWTLVDVILIATGYIGPADGSLYI
ncbi:hypothetical protein FSP39_022433 [Pinctada imbricata]|uniref:TM2 domain-containing protein n=1 Tax=Pinctada imbricata TaxID=66713 RepID=A0AA89C2L1_PINIB|nr:hypothetical protein FSP39_022433 [Pinctada imbricata]